MPPNHLTLNLCRKLCFKCGWARQAPLQKVVFQLPCTNGLQALLLLKSVVLSFPRVEDTKGSRIPREG